MHADNSSQIFISKVIPAGGSLINAHSSHYSNEPQAINKFETPFSLPRQDSLTPCPDNLIQVEILFAMRINRGVDQKPIEFTSYLLSLLVNVVDSTIWDARGMLTVSDD